MRFRSFLLAALTCALALTAIDMHAPSTADLFAQDAEAREEHRLTKSLRRKIIKMHHDLAEELTDVNMYSDARLEYELILYHDPDDDDAREGLGFKEEDGVWVKDAEWEAPMAGIDDIDVDTVKEMVEEIAEVRAEIVEEILATAKKLERKDEHEEAAILYADAAWYAPDDETVAEKRGWVKVGDEFHPAYFAEEREAAMKLLEEAEKDVKGNAVVKDLAFDAGARKIAMKKATLNKISYAAEEEERAKHVLAVSIATIRWMEEVMGKEQPDWSYLQAYEFSKQDDFDTAVKSLGKSETETAFALKMMFYWENKNSLFLDRGKAADTDEMRDEMLDDAHCGSTATWFQAQHRSTYSLDAWLYIGTYYYASGRVLGTTHSRLYTFNEGEEEEEGKYADEQREKRNGMIPDFDKENVTLATLRAMQASDARFQNSIDLNAIARKDYNEVRLFDASVAYGVIEWLMQEHRDTFVAWLCQAPSSDEDGRDRLWALYQELDMNADEFIAAYRTWVLGNF